MTILPHSLRARVARARGPRASAGSPGDAFPTGLASGQAGGFPGNEPANRFQRRGSISWQAVSAALIGWLGFGIMAVLDGARLDAAYQSTPGFHFDPLPAVAAATTWVLLGFFAVALPGGHLGRLLRIWMWDHS